MKKANFQKSREEDEVEFSNFLSDLRSHWYYFVYAGILFAASALIYYVFANPLYEATASVLVEDSKTPPKDSKDYVSYDLFGRNSTVPTEVDILQSKLILNNTIDRLNLHVFYSNTTTFPARPIYPNYPFVVKVLDLNKYLKEIPFDVTIVDSLHYQLDFEYTGKDLPSYFTSTGKYRFGDIVKNKYFKFLITRNDAQPAPASNSTFEFVVRAQNKLIADIQDHLKIENVDKDADIINITYHDNVQQRALDIVNTMNQVYIELNLKDKETMADMTIKYVDEQLKNTGKTLSSSESDLESFKEKFKTVNLSEESKALLDKINDIDLRREKNDIDITSLQNLLRYVQEHDDLTDLAPSSMGIPDPLLETLINNFQVLQRKRKNIAYGITTDAPGLKIIDQQIKDTRSTLIESIKSIQKRMQVTRTSLLAQMAVCDVQIKKVPEMQRHLISLQRNLEVNQGVYTYLMQKKAETNIQKAASVSDNKVLDVAGLSVDPYWPSKIILIIIVMFLTLVTPTGYLLGRNLLQTVVRSKNDIDRFSSFPVVGVVGHSGDKASELVVVNKPNSTIAESFRVIRANLRLQEINAGKQVILVTSSVGNEGKSFVALNLASALAMQKNKVVLLSLNLHRPKWYRDFEYRSAYGAGDYLEGKATINQIVQKTGVADLDLISSGQQSAVPSELLASPAVSTLVEELRSLYDYIVIDTAPLGVFADTYLLMKYTDINIYIFRERLSKLEYVKTMEDVSAENEMQNLYLILNDSKFRVANGYGHNYAFSQRGKGYYDNEATKWQTFLNRLPFKRKPVN